MYYYIYTKSTEGFVAKASQYIREKGLTFELIPIDALKTLRVNKEDHLIVTGSVYSIKQVMVYASQHDISLGIIPLPKQKELRATFALSSKLEKSIELALTPSQKKIDLLYCEESLVLQEVVIGEVPPLDSYSSCMEKQSLWERTKSFFTLFKKVRHLTHTSFSITTGKEKVLKFSAVGAVGVEYNNRTFASTLIAKYLKSNDGRLSLVLLSPSSIVEYMGYIFQSHILKKVPKSLPSSVGYVHSSTLTVKAQKKLTVTIDSEQCMQTPIVLRSQPEVLALSVGEEFWEKSAKIKEEKENVKVEHLPCDEESSIYLGKTIPLFAHASKKQFTSLFRNLREESQLSATFMTLLILATMIATFGLFINSASVIIGAMVLAPLMQPIVGVSMGILRQDSALILSAAKSIAIGVTAVVFSAVLITWMLPLEELTSEMNGRLSPTILDLFVAIVSGIAAAYAKSNEKIIGSLAGVAIAVALVPPLAVSGIGLGWGAWTMFSSALLLFITNLVGIVLAASLTFLVLGFSPIHVARRGLFYALTLVGIVSIPLYLSFSQMIHNIKIQKNLGQFEANIGFKRIYLREIHLHGNEVRCQVISSDVLSKEEKIELKKNITKEVGEEVKIVVSFAYIL